MSISRHTETAEQHDGLSATVADAALGLVVLVGLFLATWGIASMCDGHGQRTDVNVDARTHAGTGVAK
jgi:hypothetical protein